MAILFVSIVCYFAAILAVNGAPNILPSSSGISKRNTLPEDISVYSWSELKNLLEIEIGTLNDMLAESEILAMLETPADNSFGYVSSASQDFVTEAAPTEVVTEAKMVSPYEIPTVTAVPESDVPLITLIPSKYPFPAADETVATTETIQEVTVGSAYGIPTQTVASDHNVLYDVPLHFDHSTVVSPTKTPSLYDVVSAVTHTANAVNKARAPSVQKDEARIPEIKSKYVLNEEAAKKYWSRWNSAHSETAQHTQPGITETTKSTAQFEQKVVPILNKDSSSDLYSFHTKD